METKNGLKILHLSSTLWFILCAGFLLVLALRQAGAGWLLIFSLSGHSIVIGFFLISIYLFAVFRGVVRSQNIEMEHPLTSTTPYMVFYDLCPFLGVIVGLINDWVTRGPLLQNLVNIAAGSLFTTFLVWILLDPILGMIEMLTPASRQHRMDRLAQAKEEKKERKIQSEKLLTELFRKELENQKSWKEKLEPMAKELIDLLDQYKDNPQDYSIITRTIAKGAQAWQIGGKACMQQFHEMTMSQVNHPLSIDHLSIWWDGIGTWRSPSFTKIICV